MSNDPVKAAQEATGTVFVACKLPHGVIIRDYAEGTIFENVLGGGTRKIKVFRPVGPKIRIKGPVVPTLFIRMVEVVGGYAITANVPADVFGRWMSWNRDSHYVRNHMIFGHESKERVVDWAKDHASIKSGVEPLDVTMKSEAGLMVFTDERIRTGGAAQVVDGKLEPAAA